MASLTPPQAPPSWIHTPEEVVSVTKRALAQNKAVSDKVAALPEAECNFETVFLPLADAEAEVLIICEPLAFYQNVSTSKELRDASNQAEVLQRDFDVEESMRLDVFKAKTAAEKNLRKSGEWEKLSDEQRRLVEKMVLDGKRAGLALPEKEREVLMKLKKELSQVCLDFSKNFNEEDGLISFTLEELTESRTMSSRVTASVLRAQKKSMMSLSRPQISSRSSNPHIIQPRDAVLKKDMKTDSNKMCLYLRRRLTSVGALPQCLVMTHGQTTSRK